MNRLPGSFILHIPLLGHTASPSCFKNATLWYEITLDGVFGPYVRGRDFIQHLMDLANLESDAVNVTSRGDQSTVCSADQQEVRHNRQTLVRG